MNELCVSVFSSKLQCSVWPVGALHPVQAQLERLEAGIGCAAREGGAKETHVISVGKSSNTQVQEVCVCELPVAMHTSDSGVLFPVR